MFWGNSFVFLIEGTGADLSGFENFSGVVNFLFFVILLCVDLDVSLFIIR